MAKIKMTATQLSTKIEGILDSIRELEQESPRRATYAANRKLLVERLRVARKQLTAVSATTDDDGHAASRALPAVEAETTAADPGPDDIFAAGTSTSDTTDASDTGEKDDMAKTTQATTATTTATTATTAAQKRKSRSMKKEVPAVQRRIALVTLLRKLKATTQQSARTVNDLAERLEYNPYDVYCLVYHKYPLATNGFVKTFKSDESNELRVYLTKKGVETDPK